MRQILLTPPKWLLAEADVWCKRLGLDKTWSLKIAYEPTCKVAREVVKAYSTWEPDYRHGTLHINSRIWENLDKPQHVHLLVHELIHFLHAPEDDVLAIYVGRGSKVYDEWSRANEALIDQEATLFIRSWSRKSRVV